MGNFDVTTPAGSDLLSLGDDKIREFKLAMREALRAGEVAGDDIEGVEAIFPGASPSTAPVYRYRGLKDTTANRPVSGQYGLYFDTTRNVLQRDNGSTWDDVATVIPSGTKMVFYQASAPVGWTAVAVNDKFLRVVTAGGTGGSTGGTVAASSSLSHAHTVASHTHTGPSHTHTVIGSTDAAGNHNHTIGDAGGGLTITDGTNFASWSGNHTHTLSTTTGAGGTGVTGGSSPATDNQLGVFAYADIIICQKD